MYYPVEVAGVCCPLVMLTRRRATPSWTELELKSLLRANSRLQPFKEANYTLSMVPGARSEATEAVKAVPKYVTLQMVSSFTDEAGTALAQALTVNTTLCKTRLSVKPVHASRNY
jgi:hypothetical protein